MIFFVYKNFIEKNLSNDVEAACTVDVPLAMEFQYKMGELCLQYMIIS